ncbi:MAG: ABC transporter permease [Thermomicrobiales bacterium]
MSDIVRIRDIVTELSLLVRRASTWIIVGLWLILGLFFSYILEYISYRGNRPVGAEGRIASDLSSMLPPSVVATTSSGFAFFGGALVLILAVMTFGNEFGWNMWKTLFTQRPGRMRIMLAKLGALAVLILPAILLAYVVNGIASVVIAQVEGVAITWPAASAFVEATAAGWLILMTWASLGVLLAVVTRGTGLAIGLGILYALMIEGTLSGFANTISWLKPIVEGLIRANGYSLTQGFGGGTAGGPGLFNGPYVSVAQAAIVLLAWLVGCCGISLWLMHRRDVA